MGKTEVKEVKPATVTAKYVAPATYAYPYASYAYAHPAAYHTIAKRDAEAEPEADAYYRSYYGYPGYSTYGSYGYPAYSAYRYPYTAYSAPYTYGYAYGK